MSEGAKTLRLSKVAKEFNLSLGKIVEFLATKGHKTESNPNAKIGDEEYRLLLKEFSGDKSAREEAESVAQQTNKVKRETIVLNEIKPKRNREDDFDEVVIKDLTAPKKAAPAPEKIEPPAPPAKSEPIIVKPETNDGPRVIGKLDLDAMNLRTKPDRKKKEDKPVEKAEEEAPVAEKPSAP